MPNQPQQKNVNIRVDDSVLKGVYSNAMLVNHSKEEFVLDFMNHFGPQGVGVARIITSPGHFKRIVAALNDNLKKYEQQHGAIAINNPAPAASVASESSKFGF